MTRKIRVQAEMESQQNVMNEIKKGWNEWYKNDATTELKSTLAIKKDNSGEIWNK